MNLQKTLPALLKIFGMAYLFVCLSACALQRQLLYFPAKPIESPQSYGLKDFADVVLKEGDGTSIQGWVHAARMGYPTLLYFHGNGGNMASDRHYFAALAQSGFGLLAIDYRGYGASEGEPSEQGFYEDARTAVNYAMNTLHLPAEKIVLYGESIGTGVAVQMATEFPVGGIVLQSPYTSIEPLAERQFSWLPVHYLLIDRFDSLSKIENVHAPLLLLHGERDNIVPVEYGRMLFAQANNPKEAVYFQQRGHNDMDIGERLEALMTFSRAQKWVKQ